MEYLLKYASDYSSLEIADFLTRSFEGYFVPIKVDDKAFLQMIRRDGVDIAISRVVVLADETPVGVALIARRGWTSRVAAMGVMAEWRSQGAGKFLMTHIVEDARERSDHALVLEVIEQNEPAIRLYEKFGFKKVRRLASFISERPDAFRNEALEEIDIREMARMIAVHGFNDLPWQVSAETIAQLTPPMRALKSGTAYALISNPDVEHVVFYSLLVEESARRRSKAGELVQAVIAAYPGKTWHVPATVPEEVGMVFEKMGFKRDTLSQWQMKLDL